MIKHFVFIRLSLKKCVELKLDNVTDNFVSKILQNIANPDSDSRNEKYV